MQNNLIKVLHLIDHYKIGGPGKTIVNSYRYIDKSVFEIHAGTFKATINHGSSEFINRLREVKVPMIALPDGRGVFLKSCLMLAKYVKVKKISIIHAHGYKADVIGLLVKMMVPRTKIVSSHHGWITNTETQKSMMRIDLKLARFLDGIIAVSRELYEAIPKSIRDKIPCSVIHNALVLDDYRAANQRELIRSRLGIESGEFVYGVVGRLSEEKGCIDMIKAFDLIHRQNEKTKLLFIGEGPLKARMVELIRYTKLGSNILLTGHHNPVIPFLEAIDALVCPSHTEGISNVILEALAYKKPIVATRVGGNHEIIVDGFSGSLVAAENEKELADACCKIANNLEIAKRLGENGNKTLIEKFDFRDRMRKEEKFYIKILSN